MKRYVNSVARLLFERIIDKVQLCKTNEMLSALADKMIINKSKNTISCVVIYACGKLLKKLLNNRIRELSYDIIQDSFKMFLEEGDRALDGQKEMNKDVFKDLYGEYDDGDIGVLKIILWSWVSDLVEVMEEVQFLLRDADGDYIKSCNAIDDIFKHLSLDMMKRLDREDLRTYITDLGYNEELGTQISYLYDLIKDDDDIAELIFKKNEAVIRQYELPLEKRIYGARIQSVLHNSCCFDKVYTNT